MIKTPLFDDSSYLIFLNDLIVIFTKIFDKFSNLHNLLPINDISPTVDLLLISFAKGIIKYDKQIIDTIKSNSDILKQKNLLSLFTKVEDQQREKENKIEELKNVPIDYYDKSPIITSDELQDNFRLPIQQHRPKGSYESYERYFNTLFYLEYEDCYRSLKTSIFNIKSTEANEMINVERENRDIYYYVNGEIVNIEVSPIGILLTLDFESLQKVIRFTKRMIFGSLLVITDMDYNSFLLVTIHYNPYSMEKRREKKKKEFKLPETPNRYRIQVSLININNESFVFLLRNRNKKLQIFESKAYFESYIHIMRRLQNMNIADLPFTDVLIRNDYSSMIPSYLLRNYYIKYENQIIYYESREYPEILRNQLDDSQITALDLALHSKVGIIQGPPGTGKTHLASILTKVLMQNISSPILIVCYTNHALDQFLAHFVDYTKSIVRIGGRCSDERLTPFLLSNYQSVNRRQLIAVNREIAKVSRRLIEIVEGLDKTRPVIAQTVRENFPQTYEKIIDDFFAVMKFDEKRKRKFSHLSDLLYKCWTGAVSIEDVLNRIIGTKDKNYNSYWHAFDEYYDETQKDVEYPKEKNKEEIEIVNKKFEREADVDEEDDEEELKENEDRLALQNYYEDDDEESVMLEIKEQKIDLTNVKHLHQSEFIYIVHHYNVWRLGPEIRKRLVDFIKYKSLEFINIASEDLKLFADLLNQRKEIEMVNQSTIIGQQKLIGMTTTGCAKYSTILEQNNFEIVIIEEAAEVLESHVAALLTKNTKHLIMIGDHKQLKPKPYNYEIERKFHFDVSMFERLINNKIPYATLKYQRRMKPLFADFVRLIYGNATYIDHATTKGKPPVKGFESDMFFITHSEKEEQNVGLASKSNAYEANYVIQLAYYITLQGYKPEQLTIVTLYVGQVLMIRKVAMKYNFNVRITSVDNYQGEENDFIILSLVRSNAKFDIGFLKTFNRVCVAFSRAKVGFYVLGNIDCIVEGEKRANEKYSDDDSDEESNKMRGIWSQIQQKAKEKQIIGPCLRLKCQKHGNITEIKNYRDFSKVQEGGCSKPCCQRLKCGHVCERPCHNYPHELIQCVKKCERTLPCGH